MWLTITPRLEAVVHVHKSAPGILRLDIVGYLSFPVQLPMPFLVLSDVWEAVQAYFQGQTAPPLQNFLRVWESKKPVYCPAKAFLPPRNLVQTTSNRSYCCYSACYQYSMYCWGDQASRVSILKRKKSLALLLRRRPRRKTKEQLTMEFLTEMAFLWALFVHLTLYNHKYR